MWIRLPMAVLTAIAAMGGLFALMYGLVKVTTDISNSTRATRIEFTRLKVDSDVSTNRPTKPERKETPLAPETPQIQIATGISAQGAPMKMEMTGIGDGLKLGTINVSGMAGVDREVIPLVRIQPQYPPRAASRGIEGWVRVQFNITPAGGVIDATVSDSEPRGMFDRAALEAVSRWKYNPKVESGVAVERRGVQVLLTFQLEK